MTHRPALAFLVYLASIGGCRTGAPVAQTVGTCAPPEAPRATSQWSVHDGPAGIEATIVDLGNRRPIRNATVTVMGTRLGRLADSLGRVVIDSIPPGRYEIRIRAVGRAPRADTLDFENGRRWVGEVRLPERLIQLTDECFLQSMPRR
jgi:hypothetical protein